MVSFCPTLSSIILKSLISFLFVFSFQHLCNADPVSICYESADVLPWRSADGKGLNFELLKEVTDQTGIEFKYTALPWKRCLAGLKANDFDGAIGASHSLEREAFAVYPGPRGMPDVNRQMYTDRYVFLRKKGTSIDWNGQKLEGHTGEVGVQLGYSVSNELLRLGMEIDDGAQGGRQLVHKLVAGHVRVIAMLEGEARWLLENDPTFSNIEILQRPISEKAYFLIFSKAYKEAYSNQAERIWKTIEMVRKYKANPKTKKITSSQR
jgi:polar amino acid transport system substrate-binding protein